MRLRIFTEPQFGVSDHYLTMGGDGLPGPTDAWITVAGVDPHPRCPSRHRPRTLR